MTTDESDFETTDSGSESLFSLVGNEIRAAIIRVFGDARLEQRSRPTLSFSEMRSAIDQDPHSSQFNYHLQKLVGNFLEKTESGYRMRPEGHALYKRIAAGTFGPREAPSPLDAGFECHHCETDVEARFEDGLVRIKCPGCDYLYEIAFIPPGSVATEEGLLEQVAMYAKHEHLAVARGLCPTCGSSLTSEFVDPEATPFEGGHRDKIAVYRSCTYCTEERYLSVGEILLADTEVIAFCQMNGDNVIEQPLWEVDFAATDRYVTVEGTDPWRVALKIRYDDTKLRLVIDEDLQIVNRTRR